MQEEASEFAAFIGIDWADRKHDVCLQVAGTETCEVSVLEHRPTVIDAWARRLRERFGGRPIAVCLELSQGPIVSALLEHDIFVIFPVNPSTLAKYRRAFTPSRAKDDPTDAALALELLRRHPEKIVPLRRESPNMRALRRLVEARRDLVQDRVRLTNRLIFTLKSYFPQVIDWFRDKETDVFAAFVERWPSLPDAQRARRDTIVDFFHAHSVRRASVIDRRIDAIKSELPLTSDVAVIEPALLVVSALLPQLRALNAGISRLDAEIAARCADLPDFRLFADLPGAGPVFASRLLAAFGEHAGPLRRRRRVPEVRRNRACYRAQRQQALGPLALGLLHVPSANLRRMGGQLRPSFVLGPRLLREPQSQGGLPQRHHPRTRLQVDPHPLSLLDEPHSLRRIPLPLRPPEAAITAPQIRRPRTFIIRLRSASGRGLGSSLAQPEVVAFRYQPPPQLIRMWPR
jgi:transposase